MSFGPGRDEEVEASPTPFLFFIEMIMYRMSLVGPVDGWGYDGVANWMGRTDKRNSFLGFYIYIYIHSNTCGVTYVP